MTISTIASSHFALEGKNRNEFTAEVLAALLRRKVSFRGCKPSHISIGIESGVEIQFAGYRDSKPWTGSVKFDCPFAPDKLMLANPAIVADICEQGIHLMDAT